MDRLCVLSAIVDLDQGSDETDAPRTPYPEVRPPRIQGVDNKALLPKRKDMMDV